jgi:hypothetical protein
MHQGGFHVAGCRPTPDRHSERSEESLRAFLVPRFLDSCRSPSLLRRKSTYRMSFRRPRKPLRFKRSAGAFSPASSIWANGRPATDPLPRRTFPPQPFVAQGAATCFSVAGPGALRRALGVITRSVATRDLQLTASRERARPPTTLLSQPVAPAPKPSFRARFRALHLRPNVPPAREESLCACVFLFFRVAHPLTPARTTLARLMDIFQPKFGSLSPPLNQRNT